MKFERADSQTLTAEQFAEKYGEYPVDRNDPEGGMAAIYYTVPAGFSAKAKAAMDYLDGSAFIFEYKGRLVVTDEGLYLTTHGDGSKETPMGFPRTECDSWDEIEKWLELVYQEGIEEGFIEPVAEHDADCARFVYGMRLRGFSIGCQPMDGFVEREDDPDGRYHDVIVYDRPLTKEEMSDYELDFIEGRKE